MKRLFAIAAVILALQACHGSDQGGAVNDGRKYIEGRRDTPGYKQTPAIDTSVGEDRVDIQQRHQ